MTEAQNLIIKYFRIVCRLDSQDTPIDFEVIQQWSQKDGFYKQKVYDAIQCAISETEAIMKAIGTDIVYEYDYYKSIINQLKQMQ